ncbi:hypothetical protein N779_24635 [Vibrio coralliilyticus OCN008]|nr:hypothetical protein N779_24635 [Vibrio coralliilyticus OCN008]
MLFAIAILTTCYSFYKVWKGSNGLGLSTIVSGGVSLACLDIYAVNIVLMISSLVLLILNVVLHFTPDKKET